MNEITMAPYKVYVRVDDAGRITAINSSAFLSNVDGWTLIDEGYGNRYHHAQGNYLAASICDDRGIPRYKLKDSASVERTREEMDADFAARSASETITEELLLETAGNHEYRLCLMELGATEDDLQGN